MPLLLVTRSPFMISPTWPYFRASRSLLGFPKTCVLSVYFPVIWIEVKKLAFGGCCSPRCRCHDYSALHTPHAHRCFLRWSNTMLLAVNRLSGSDDVRRASIKMVWCVSWNCQIDERRNQLSIYLCFGRHVLFDAVMARSYGNYCFWLLQPVYCKRSSQRQTKFRNFPIFWPILPLGIFNFLLLSLRILFLLVALRLQR